MTTPGPVRHVDPDAFEADPEPLLAELRAEAPVCHVPELGMWLVTRWDDVAHIEAHPELFTAATEPSWLARALGPNMLTCDPPEHTRLRRIFGPPLTSGGRAGDVVRDELPELADELIDTFVDEGRVELVSAYAQPFSAAALSLVLGLGEPADRVWRWCEGLCADISNFTDDPERAALGDAARDELGEVLARRLDELDRRPDGSALSAYLAAGADRDEIIANVRLMISGGINEPADGIGLVVWTVLQDPDLGEGLGDDPRRWRHLVEEVLRRHSPVGTVTRQTTREVTLGGVTLPAGALVAGVLRSIDLDEDHWSDPTRIDPERREGPHAAFALGAHRCIGEWLGRQEIRVACQRLLARLADRDLALDPDAGPVELHGFEFRGPRALHLHWSTSR